MPKLKRANQRNQRQEAQYLNPKPVNTGLTLSNIMPKTFTQARIFRDFERGDNLVLHGCAGTGKTFLSMYLALRAIENNDYKKVVIFRSATAVHDIGHLPGTAQDKISVYEAPYIAIASELYHRGDAYSVLKQRKVVEFESTSFIRGITVNDAVVILDEWQNFSNHEIHSVLTRIGKNCRVILAGDGKQTDYIKNGSSGFNKYLKVLLSMDGVSSVELKQEDIVRSGFVRDYIIALDNYENEY